MVKYYDLARELKKLGNIRVLVVLIVAGELGTIIVKIREKKTKLGNIRVLVVLIVVGELGTIIVKIREKKTKIYTKKR